MRGTFIFQQRNPRKSFASILGAVGIRTRFWHGEKLQEFALWARSEYERRLGFSARRIFPAGVSQGTLTRSFLAERISALRQ